MFVSYSGCCFLTMMWSNALTSSRTPTVIVLHSGESLSDALPHTRIPRLCAGRRALHERPAAREAAEMERCVLEQGTGAGGTAVCAYKMRNWYRRLYRKMKPVLLSSHVRMRPSVFPRDISNMTKINDSGLRAARDGCG